MSGVILPFVEGQSEEEAIRVLLEHGLGSWGQAGMGALPLPAPDPAWMCVNGGSGEDEMLFAISPLQREATSPDRRQAIQDRLLS